MREYYMIIEKDSEGWYVGSILGLQGCHTQGRSIDELTKRMEEALELYLEPDNDSLTDSTFIGVHKVSVPLSKEYHETGHSMA